MCSARLLLLAALTVAAAGGGRGAGAGAGGGGPQWCAGAGGAARAVVAAAGGAVTLRCCVRRQADRAVSWVRARDLQILAHAGLVFSADTRLTVPRTVAPSPGPGAGPGAEAGAGAVHLLRIAAVRASDAGRYECQLNTEPKMSQYVQLEVTDHEDVPDAGGVRVWAERAGAGAGAGAGGCGAGAGEDGAEAEGSVFVCAGEAVTLVCEARRSAAPVQWVRPGDTRAVAVPVSVSADSDSGSGSGSVVSRLRLRSAAARHAGTYWCEAGAGGGGGARAALRVRVTQPGARTGDAVPRVESMQRDGAPPPLLAARAPPHPPPRPAPAAALALALGLLLAAR